MPKKKKTKKSESYQAKALRKFSEDESAIREKDHKQAKRRKDGTLECPPRYLEGYTTGLL